MITAELIVFLKDADLVATTAFLTLTGKMGYAETLLGLKRFDYFKLTLGRRPDEDPEAVIGGLRRVLSSQTTFYNRNKHHYLLSCSWNGGSASHGTDLELARRKLATDVSKAFEYEKDRNLRVQRAADRIILRDKPVFLASLLVQEIEPAGRRALSGKLSEDLSGRSIDFIDKGVMWWMAIRTPERSQAKQVLEEMTVTVKRDKGLLVNPNYQSYRVISVAELDLNDV
jgi:hypothetical protein